MSHMKSNAQTARNKARLMELLKDPSNKHCADCKVSKNPRWASWNLGLFICIRCSGIHRSLGTHITRVKSVDLDSWTDEQTESMCNWGNSKANQYWEAKLNDGRGDYVPVEGKVESFVRTKYVLGKWKADGERNPDRFSSNNGTAARTNITSSTNASTNISTSTTKSSSLGSPLDDSINSLLEIAPTPTAQSVESAHSNPASLHSMSSLNTSTHSINRSKTNPTISLLEQQPPLRSHSRNDNKYNNNGNSNNRHELKKSILSLYSTPTPSQSNVSLTNNSPVSVPSTATSSANVNTANSNIWNTPAIATSKTYVPEDPFRNVWN